MPRVKCVGGSHDGRMIDLPDRYRNGDHVQLPKMSEPAPTQPPDTCPKCQHTDWRRLIAEDHPAWLCGNCWTSWGRGHDLFPLSFDYIVDPYVLDQLNMSERQPSGRIESVVVVQFLRPPNMKLIDVIRHQFRK